MLAAVYLTCVLCAGCAAATPPSPADGVAPNLDATVNARVSATLAAIPPTATTIPPAPTSKPTVAPSATSTAVPSPTSIPVPTATAVPAGPSDAEKTRAIRDAFTRVWGPSGEDVPWFDYVIGVSVQGDTVMVQTSLPPPILGRLAGEDAQSICNEMREVLTNERPDLGVVQVQAFDRTGRELLGC